MNAELNMIASDDASRRGAGMLIKVSCIIPTLNRSADLCNAVQMLLEQTYPLHEIIIVDQTRQPDENTRYALSRWELEKKIRWLRQEQPSASKARNKGAVATSGDVLLFLDDDIHVDRGFVEAHTRNYLDPTIVAVAGQVLEREKRVTDILRSPPDDPEIGWIRFPKNYNKRCVTAWMAAGNFSVRRGIYFQIGGMDENYRRGSFREETDFAMRFLRAGYRFQFDPAASITHLGVSAVPHGGARSWANPLQWHHCIGDWYFNLRFARGKSAFRLYWYSFRHLVASRYNLVRPWRLPLAAVCWLSSAPIALWLRLGGAKLCAMPETTPAQAFRC